MDPAQERSEVLRRMDDAVTILIPSVNPQLIPPDGAQIGYALRGARDKEDIAAVPGRMMVENQGTWHPRGSCSFGCDDVIARVILTVMKFDPRRRCAAQIRCSDRVLDVLDGDLFLECMPYDAAKAPQGISTMDWGIASCCKKEVPDVMYPTNDDGPGATLLLLGEEPAAVANNIIICSNRI